MSVRSADKQGYKSAVISLEDLEENSVGSRKWTAGWRKALIEATEQISEYTGEDRDRVKELALDGEFDELRSILEAERERCGMWKELEYHLAKADMYNERGNERAKEFHALQASSVERRIMEGETELGDNFKFHKGQYSEAWGKEDYGEALNKIRQIRGDSYRTTDGSDLLILDGEGGLIERREGVN